MAGLIEYTLQEFQDVLLASLVGKTLTGAGTPSMVIVLKRSPDFFESGLGAFNCLDGGVQVKYGPGNELQTLGPQSTGGSVQREWAHRFTISVTVSIACPVGVLYDNLLSLEQEIVNLVELLLEPQADGEARYNFKWAPLNGPVRHPKNSSFAVFTLGLTFTGAWTRS